MSPPGVSVRLDGLRPAGATGLGPPLHLTVAPGEARCLRGASGAGKSTLLAQLALALPTPPGQYGFFGADPAAWSAARRGHARATHVGWTRQGGNLIGGLSVLDNVLLPARLAGASLRREAAYAVLAALDLTDLARRRATALSGGEAGRAALARTLWQRPPLVLADEPTAGQDPARAALVCRALQALRDGGSAVVVATHDAALAAALGPSAWLDADGPEAA